MKLRTSWSKKIPFAKLDELFKLVGWRPRGAKKWRKVLGRSDCVFSVWDGGKLAGFGRFFHDGVFCYLQDIMVHPDYQHRGIGSKIMNALEGKVAGKGFAEIGLQPWDKQPSLVRFYEKLGWKKFRAMQLTRRMDPE